MKNITTLLVLVVSLQACAVAKTKPQAADTPRYDLGFQSISWLEFNAVQIGAVEAGEVAIIEMAPHDPDTPSTFEAWIGGPKAPIVKVKAQFVEVRKGLRWYRMEIPVPKVNDGQIYFRIEGSGNNYEGKFPYHQ